MLNQHKKLKLHGKMDETMQHHSQKGRRHLRKNKNEMRLMQADQPRNKMMQADQPRIKMIQADQPRSPPGK